MKGQCDARMYPNTRKGLFLASRVWSRKFRLIFFVSASAVLTAILTTALKTSLFLMAQQSPMFEVNRQEIGSAHIRPIQLVRAMTQRARQNISADNNIRHRRFDNSDIQNDFASNKMVLVLDFWERMINIQSGLRRLVQLGVDSGFTVVEPFVYESKVTGYYAFPEQFRRRNMTPQTAALYFHTEDLFATNRYITHDTFRQKFRLNASRSSTESNKTRKQDVLDLIQAAVFIDWTKPSISQAGSAEGSQNPFYWCDNQMQRSGLPRSAYGWVLGPNLHVQRALCLASRHTIAPARFDAGIFDRLFAFVKNGTTTHHHVRCAKCVALAFMNYRKHAFSGFVAHTGAMPFKQKTPPLRVGKRPQALAERVRTELLGSRSYIALQLRTGKPFAIFEKYEKRLAARGLPVARYEKFKSWLKSCTDRLVVEGIKAARPLGRKTPYYIASDMYNNGWKGGERCPPEVKMALGEAKQRLRAGLRRVHWFHPHDFGVRQDAMGIAGLVDAAVCLKADRFMFAVPSNFGKWVFEQRAIDGGSGTIKVDCMDPRFNGEF